MKEAMRGPRYGDNITEASQMLILRLLRSISLHCLWIPGDIYLRMLMEVVHVFDEHDTTLVYKVRQLSRQERYGEGLPPVLLLQRTH